jgi:hypothetical protein
MALPVARDVWRQREEYASQEWRACDAGATTGRNWIISSACPPEYVTVAKGRRGSDPRAVGLLANSYAIRASARGVVGVEDEGCAAAHTADLNHCD